MTNGLCLAVPVELPRLPSVDGLYILPLEKSPALSTWEGGAGSYLHKQADDRHAQDVEDNDALEGHLHGVRDQLPEVFGLGAGQCDHLDVAKGIGGGNKSAEEAEVLSGIAFYKVG